MHPPLIRSRSNVHSRLAFIVITAVSLWGHSGLLASASAVVATPVTTARLGSKTRESMSIVSNTAATATATPPPTAAEGTAGDFADAIAKSPASKSGTNPIAQLATYVKDTVVNFKNGLAQMNTDHRSCNSIRAKQRTFAKAKETTRPRGIKGVQTGGISYEEYDFLRKGLVDRNKLFAVTIVSLCLPNYFVYYMWTFPDMMPSPFLKGKDTKEISRERCHAVISTLLDIEKGARVAPWSAKLNPFGRKATEKAMERLGTFVSLGSANMGEYGAVGSNGGRMLLKKLKPELYTSSPLTKQQLLLAGKIVPKQIMKGLTKAIATDPLNKGSSPFGIGAVKHIESVTLADEFLVDQGVDINSIHSNLLAEACSSRLIGGPGWTDEERKEGLSMWLQETEIVPREITGENEGLYFNGNLARAALMSYNAVDGTRDERADSGLLRAMYQGQDRKSVV